MPGGLGRLRRWRNGIAPGRRNLRRATPDSTPTSACPPITAIDFMGRRSTVIVRGILQQHGAFFFDLLRHFEAT